jgi:hypothetical protein
MAMYRFIRIMQYIDSPILADKGALFQLNQLKLSGIFTAWYKIANESIEVKQGRGHKLKSCKAHATIGAENGASALPVTPT